MNDPVYAGLGPTEPHATIALDLTVNGEPMHFEQPFPLAAWDAMTAEERAVAALSWMRGAAAELVDKFAERITVTRYEGRRPWTSPSS